MADYKVGGAYLEWTMRNSQFLNGLRQNAQGMKKNQQALRRLRRDMSRFNRQVRVLTQRLGLLATVGIGLAVRSFGKFSETMATVRGVASATGSQFDLLREQALSLGRTTRFTATEVAEGQLFLARAGFEVSQIYAALPGTLQLAQASTISLGESADFVSNILSGFREQASETARFVDVLAKTTTSSNTNMRQLANAMQYVAPIAASLGVQVEETAAAIGVLSNAGLQGEMAGAGLRTAMAAIVAPSAKAQGIIRSLGLTMEDLSIEQHGLIEVFRRLRDSGITTAQSFQLFEKRGGTAFQVLADGIPKMSELKESLLAAAGTATELARIQNDTLTGSFKRVLSAAEGFGLRLFDVTGAGESLKGSLDSLARGINVLTDNLQRFASADILDRAVFLASRLFGFWLVVTRIIPVARAVAQLVIQFGVLRGGLLLAAKAARLLFIALKVGLLIEGFIQLGHLISNVRGETAKLGVTFGQVATTVAVDFLQTITRAIIKLPDTISKALQLVKRAVFYPFQLLGEGIAGAIEAGINSLSSVKRLTAAIMGRPSPQFALERDDIGGSIADSLKETFDRVNAETARAFESIWDQQGFFDDLAERASFSDNLLESLGLSANDIAGSRAAFDSAARTTWEEFLKSWTSVVGGLDTPAVVAIQPPLIADPKLAENALALNDAMKEVRSSTRSAQGAFESFFVRLADGFDSASDAVRQLVRELRNIIVRETFRPLSERLATAFGSVIARPIPAAQHGGRHHGLTLVGERGPEIVDFRQPANVIPAPETARLRSQSGGGGNIQLDFHFAAGTDAGAIRGVMDEYVPQMVDVMRAVYREEARSR